MKEEDITDDVIESRDVEEDLTTVYLKGYADAEEKYRKKIKELETKQKAMCEEYCPKTERIKELEVLEDDLKDKRVVYIDTPEFAENYIPVQKIKDKIEENKDTAKRVAGTYQYADSGDDLEEKKSKVIELRTKAEALEELLEDK